MKDKRYKPGQLVTIDSQVFRIRQRNYRGFSTCNICEKVNSDDICRITPCNKSHKIYDFCRDLPYGYYLERVTPKHI